ncbi:MAG: hypothetical protein KatS3mg003_1269 [Candidatus Nitrosocaldaceae archaeon]|nr:MAG: hypothetical protein KatS3mg003_0698 [Candidatus Nitrosocaldaceae archaeon]GIU71790.1 MAG: hypothetical protein KatS3mg003_1269 [Candidatus Nitrosocaldaceae archaeon]
MYKPYRCRCGVLLDKEWMSRSHKCQWREKRQFIKLFIITELILLSAVGIIWLFRL